MKTREIVAEVKEMELENIRLKGLVTKLEKDLTEKGKKPLACEYCKYFIQHYIKYEFGYIEVYKGSCKRLRSTNLKNNNDCCKYFELNNY